MLGKGMCAGALWKALLGTVPSAERSLTPGGEPCSSPAFLLLCCIHIWLQGCFPRSAAGPGWQLSRRGWKHSTPDPELAQPCRPLCVLCQLARGSLEPGVLLNTTQDLSAPSPLPLPHWTRTVRSPRTAVVPTRAKLLTAGECHLLLPSFSQNSFLPGVPWSGESKSCSEQAMFNVDGEEAQQFLLESRACDAGGL